MKHVKRTRHLALFRVSFCFLRWHIMGGICDLISDNFIRFSHRILIGDQGP